MTKLQYGLTVGSMLEALQAFRSRRGPIPLAGADVMLSLETLAMALQADTAAEALGQLALADHRLADLVLYPGTDLENERRARLAWLAVNSAARVVQECLINRQEVGEEGRIFLTNPPR